MKFSLIVLVFLSICPNAWADVRSISGTITFDVNGDNSPEMTLNSNGLGIGTGVNSGSNLIVSGNCVVTGALVVGGSTGSSNLHVNGSFGLSVQSTSSNLTLAEHSLVLVNSNAPATTVEVVLPQASTMTGRVYTVKKTASSGNVLLRSDGSTSSSNLIDSSGHVLLTEGSYGAISILSDGSRWCATSSLNALFGPPVNGDNLILWIDPSQANSVVLDSAGNVSAIRDLSGREHHLTASGNNPVYTTAAAGLNGLRCMYFDGAQLAHANTGNSRSPTEGLSVFIVFQFVGGDAWSQLYRHGVYNGAYFDIQRNGPDISSQVRIDYGGTNNQGTGSIGTTFNGTPVLLNVILDVGNKVRYAYENAGGVSTKNIGTLAAPFLSNNFITIGASTAERYIGKIGEIIVLNKVLTASERIALRTYLMTKWGL